ncbi:anti-sigma F factor antagonist [Marinicrinis sediminis]|uniref:Anti-sigma F factor antagonist n=1 Tax=Marinicrinis sediminis TaxID=1652465 RepID=A0ABW5RE33_9BACL
MSMELEMDTHPSAVIVRLKGELDHHTADLVRSRMEEVIEQGNRPHVILSMKELTFMDSSGLGVILGRYKQLSNRGGKMVVCDMNESVYRLFEMSGLFKILTIEENEEHALSSLGVVS